MNSCNTDIFFSNYYNLQSVHFEYFFRGLCDYSDKFPKMFCSSCGGECPSTANFCHLCGQQLNLSQVSNKAAILVDKEKLFKMYFHRGYPYVALIMCTSDCGSGCVKSCGAFYR